MSTNVIADPIGNLSADAFAPAIALWHEWNAKINVISRKDEDNIYAHHILHSLAIYEYLNKFSSLPSANGNPSLLDLGTGGGFPGIPLAIAMPDAQFTLCDSIGKKVRVAQAVAEGLGLKNVTCVHSRVEDLPGTWDWVVSRAVTSLENLYPWVKGRYRRGILCLKGGDVESEIAALQKRFKVPAANIRVWPISEWLKDDPYYNEKYVVGISAQAL
ncbi:MAG: 16S rRNA (guanine(527)-N(7))-methyltransferase RsmG [Bacteroidales bacterium]|nr:16S rRNA (guanine(527)-N(7))-methyltransferase RsmG [Bacteroidales bacterium]